MLRTLSALFSVGLLGISLACGASSSSSPGRDAPPDVASNGQTAASIPTSTSAPRSPSTNVEVGNKVGNRVPEFSMRLTDGAPLVQRAWSVLTNRRSYTFSRPGVQRAEPN